MEDHHYFENPAPEEKVLRYDAIVPNVWDYTMSEYASVLASHHNRVGGFAKESKRQSVEEHFAPHRVHWRTQTQYWEDYDKQDAWR
jgi:hypothetical protein